MTSATPTTYCAPCISDLALVREAVTSVAGTASCMAHAVLLTHSSDDPGRRRQRLDALRDLATSKAETADPAEQVKLELLVQEYGLAGAMDMGGPARRAPQQPQGGGAPGERRPKSRRGRGRGEGGERPERPAGERPPREPREPREGRGQQRPADGETAPVTPAPGPAGEGAPETPVQASPEASAPASSAPESAPAESAASQPQSAAPAAPAAPAEPTSPPTPPAAPESAAAPAAEPTAVPPTSDPDA